MKKLFLSVLLILTCVAAMAQAGMWVGVRNVRIEKKSKQIVYAVNAEYPFTEDSVTANAIREWINESLGGTYTGNLMEYNKLLEHYADAAIAEAADLAKKDAQSAAMIAETGPSEEKYEFKRNYETGNIITYRMTGDIYSSGAAHGMPIDLSITFRKSDGRRFGWEMFSKKEIDRLKAIIVKKLRVDYGDGTFFKVPNAADPDFELPEMDPFIGNDGIVFTYAPYEIAPYSEGFITVTLPFPMVKGMLTATGQTFISAL